MTVLNDPPGLVSLAGFVRECAVAGVGRRVLLLRTDLLPPALSHPHHLQRATEALAPLRDADRAQRFELAHGRLAAAWRGEHPALLQRALAALEALLLGAPLDAPALPDLARVFDLPREGTALLAQASSPSAQARAAPAARKAQRRPPLPPIDLHVLELMEDRLSSGSVARFARRRPVCAIRAGTFVPEWETRFLHINELMETLAPGRNPYADPWLFRRLTRILDRRMLAMLAMGTGAELRGAGPFSLNLNVSGVLSPEFLRFDAALPPTLRGHTVIDLQPTDVLADLPAFHFARSFARARGHRILLRGLTPTLLQALDLSAFDVDFAELRWSPTLAGLDTTLLRAAGPTRWVLARADEPAAVQWGEKAGITLFSGDMARPPGPRTLTPQAVAA